ncbi:hypothetical protein WN944_029229 [Citrus x changshan-huyou]|uniref:Uncharacterized protein n=1 Tax=Citrus x changshan-huyou TaxID=2935761 RepID=A0AAP0LLQ3_9ROSI
MFSCSFPCVSGTNGIVLTSHRDPKNLSRATLSVLMLKPGCKRNLFGKLLNKTIRRWLAKSLSSYALATEPRNFAAFAAWNFQIGACLAFHFRPVLMHFGFLAFDSGVSHSHTLLLKLY